MNPIQAVSISLTQNTTGDFLFKAEIAGGQLQGYPVLRSASVTAGMVILVDAADFFSATGDDPRFDVSDQAVLHIEDTAPAHPGVTVGRAATASMVEMASPVGTEAMARMGLRAETAMTARQGLTEHQATTA